MDKYGHIRCLTCGICWGDHPPDTPCVRYRPAAAAAAGAVELPIGAGPDVVRAARADGLAIDHPNGVHHARP